MRGAFFSLLCVVSNLLSLLPARAEHADFAILEPIKDISTTAHVTYYPGNVTQSWPSSIGRGIEVGYLVGKFSNDTADDLAAICISPQDSIHTLVTTAPGTTTGLIWEKPLSKSPQLTFYLLEGDFNGDGASDLGALYNSPTPDDPHHIAMRITFGPAGTSQTSVDADWVIDNGARSAFLSGDFIGQDSVADLAVISRNQSGEMHARFFTGPNGNNSGLSEWSLGTGTPRVFRSGDFNADGKLDLAVILIQDQAFVIRIAYGPDGTLSDDDWTLPRNSFAQFFARDYDGDGYSDIGAYHFSSGEKEVEIYFLPSLAKSPLRWTLSPAISDFVVSGDFDQDFRPTNLYASDGTFDSFIRIVWDEVPGAESYRVFRAPHDSGEFSEITRDIVTSQFDDASAIPGVIYDYKAQSISGNRLSEDSNVDSGYRDNDDGTLPPPTKVKASDGTRFDGTAITWAAVGGATSYLVFRADSPLDTGVFIGETAQTDFLDSTGEECRIYHYYVRAVRNEIESEDSLRDSGFRATSDGCNTPPPAPTNLVAADGESPEDVAVSWNSTPRTDYYELYRSQFSGDRGARLATTVTANYRDYTAVPGVRYYYSTRATNQFGASDFSNTDAGYRSQADGDAPDCDGDGVSDAQEEIDGTGICDPGSFQLHLVSPAFARYNTFLQQFSYLELIATGTRAIHAAVTVYDINGAIVGQVTLQIEPLQQRDIDIPAIVNRDNTYGVVRVDFNDSEPGATLAGRMSHYRREKNGNYSFAFGKELRNPTRGITYSTGNSFDPQYLGYLVPNWAEVVNLDSISRGFTHNLYDQAGRLLKSDSFYLPSLGARDLQAGHEYGEGVYLSEFLPLDGATKYLSSVTRYSSNSPAGYEPDSYNFAFSLEGRAGTGESQFLPITNKTGGCWAQTNWIEVLNIRERPVLATLSFRDSSGATIDTQEITYDSRSQYHFQTGALLPKNAHGSVEVVGADPGSLITQSLIYFHDVCGTNQLHTAYASPGRISGQDVQAGSFNSNLQMLNQTNIIATSAESQPFKIELRSEGQLLSEFDGLLGGLNLQDFALNQSQFGVAPNMYGTITIRTNNHPRKCVAENLRMREVGGTMDFVMQTPVQ